MPHTKRVPIFRNRFELAGALISLAPMFMALVCVLLIRLGFTRRLTDWMVAIPEFIIVGLIVFGLGRMRRGAGATLVGTQNS
jgi:hypothetical protein